MNIARKLVQDVHSAGGTIVAAGGGLSLSAPEPLPDSLMEDLRQHKAVRCASRMDGCSWGEAPRATRRRRCREMKAAIGKRMNTRSGPSELILNVRDQGSRLVPPK